MSKLLRAYVDQNDQVYKKVEDKNGAIRHFKNGTPVTENSFNGGMSQLKYKGQPAEVAVPSDKKGVDYERVEVSPQEASAIGQELNLSRDDTPGQPRKQLFIDGRQYDTDDIVDLNRRVVDRYGPDAVMRY